MQAVKNIPVRKIKIPGHPAVAAGQLRIRTLQELLSGRMLHQDFHRHDFFYILAVQKGSGSHQIDFTTYEICDNCLFFLRPGQMHMLTVDAGSRGYLLQFDKSFFSSEQQMTKQLTKISTRNHYCFDPEAFAQLVILFASISREQNSKGENFQHAIQAYIAVLFIEIARHLDLREKVGHSIYIQQQYQKLIELIELHSREHKQVRYYAEILNLSSFQLHSVAKTMTGKNCSELIHQHITVEAKRNLLSTSSQIKEIAYLLGYSDVSYFIRFFKKQTGFSPATFRKNLK